MNAIYIDLKIPSPTEPLPDFMVTKCLWECSSTNTYKPSVKQIQDILSGCNQYGKRVVAVINVNEWTNPVIFFFDWYLQFDDYYNVEKMYQMNHKQLSVDTNEYFKCFVDTAKSMNIMVSSSLIKSECEMLKTIAPSYVINDLFLLYAIITNI